MQPNPMPSPVVYPALRINGEDFEFRFTHSSRLLLNKWGYYDLAQSIPALVWAAAMAGYATVNGGFRSAGFLNPTEFSDKLDVNDDLTPVYQAVTDALKKAAPKATPTLVPSPAKDPSKEPQVA